MTRYAPSSQPTPLPATHCLASESRHVIGHVPDTSPHVTLRLTSSHPTLSGALARTTTHHIAQSYRRVHVPRTSSLMSLVHLRLSPCAHHAPRLLHPLSPARGLSRLQPHASTYTTTRSGCEPRAACSSTARRSRSSAWQRGWWGPVGCQRGVRDRGVGPVGCQRGVPDRGWGPMGWV